MNSSYEPPVVLNVAVEEVRKNWSSDNSCQSNKKTNSSFRNNETVLFLSYSGVTNISLLILPSGYTLLIKETRILEWFGSSLAPSDDTAERKQTLWEILNSFVSFRDLEELVSFDFATEFCPLLVKPFLLCVLWKLAVFSQLYPGYSGTQCYK